MTKCGRFAKCIEHRKDLKACMIQKNFILLTKNNIDFLKLVAND